MIKSAPAPAIELPDLAATDAFGRRLAKLLRRGDVVALKGGLGVGKTTLARAIVAGLSPEQGEVPSPTFTLVQVYDLPGAPVWHFDLYRLTRPEEAWELGLEEALAGAISLIEWPERLGGLLPADRLEVALAPGEGENARRARIVAHGAWRARLAGLERDG